MHDVSLHQIASQDELLQLALNAYRNGDANKALFCLKEAASRKDATAAAHFLLGGEYAQLGAYDQAIPHMETAIIIDPTLDIARLSLGLLLLTFGHEKNTESALLPLQDAPEDNPLHHFSKGLIHLIHDQFPECVQSLNQGITLNTENAVLNNDMNHILEEIKNMEFNASLTDSR